MAAGPSLFVKPTMSTSGITLRAVATILSVIPSVELGLI
jgi:hypothetical protein